MQAFDCACGNRDDVLECGGEFDSYYVFVGVEAQVATGERGLEILGEACVATGDDHCRRLAGSDFPGKGGAGQDGWGQRRGEALFGDFGHAGESVCFDAFGCADEADWCGCFFACLLQDLTQVFGGDDAQDPGTQVHLMRGMDVGWQGEAGQVDIVGACRLDACGQVRVVDPEFYSFESL